MSAAGYDKVRMLGVSLRGTLLKWLQILLLWMLSFVQEAGKNMWSKPSLHPFTAQHNTLKLL